VKKVLILNKKEGETPLETLEFFRAKNKEYKNSKMTYAGRLDPMASGVLIILVDEKIKNKEEYLNLEKEYEFEILFGFSTDTYDILGKVLNNKKVIFSKKFLEKEINKNLKFFTGNFIQEYPIYSSKTVAGRQLFSYARANEEVEVPKREVNVKNLKLLKIRKIIGKNLINNIEKRIKKVKGDFRQEEILKIWKKEIELKEQYFIASFKVKCSSGTYVRGIANSLGNKAQIPALAFSIKRTKIGKFVL
jgi:tRNA pseudouridine55 synthase